MTPEQERALIEATTAGLDDDLRDAYQELLALIRAGTPPRDAVAQVVASFAQDTAAAMSQAFSAMLSLSVGSASAIALDVSTVQLSQRLYTQGTEVSAVVQSIVDKQLKGFMDARALALELFEGYSFRAPGAEPLQFNPSNPALPKYLREALLADSGMQGDIAKAFAKLQVDNLGTGPLRAAYADVLRALDGLEGGAGQALLDKKLKTAFYERMRYFANRIVRTELHRAYELREAQIIMDDPDIQYVQIRRNPASDSVCICSLIAGRDRYGLGPGVYPKALAPVPPSHPHCLCVLSPRLDLTGKKAKPEDPDADRYFLSRVGESMSARIVGSQDKLARVMAGADATDIYNATTPPAYRVKVVGEVVKP